MHVGDRVVRQMELELKKESYLETLDIRRER